MPQGLRSVQSRRSLSARSLSLCDRCGGTLARLALSARVAWFKPTTCYSPRGNSRVQKPLQRESVSMATATIELEAPVVVDDGAQPDLTAAEQASAEIASKD